jgi:hypothetical protein
MILLVLAYQLLRYVQAFYYLSIAALSLLSIAADTRTIAAEMHAY